MHVFIKLLISLVVLKCIKTQNSEECGKKRDQSHSDSLTSGSNVAASDYPWHIGVYTSDKKYICGGSILNRKVILSAAHCFTDFLGKVEPKEDYLIAAGKYYSTYDDPRDENAQYSTIDSIHIPEGYKGSMLQYQSDIAVIILTNALDLSEAVQPVCIDLTNEFESEQLTPASHGILTGWGLNKENNTPSEELKEMNLPLIPFEQCFDEVPRNFRMFIRPDKICAGYSDNSNAVCAGDGGGAWVFARKSNNRYYIRGVASVYPPSKPGICEATYGTHTLISSYLEFINDLLTLNRI